MRSGRRRIRFPHTPRDSRAKASSRRSISRTLKREAEALVETQAQLVIAADWPLPADAGTGVLADEPPRVRVEVLDPAVRGGFELDPPLPPVDAGPPVDKNGSTFLDAVALGIRDALRADPRVFLYGEDVGGKYGNAFLLLRPLLAEFGDRILNSILAEGGVLGVCIGAALAGSAADWRDAVQRLRRERIQSAREQRREDPVQVGRVGTDGRAHAVGRPPPRRAVP